MKYCNDYAALLDLFVDGELTPAEMVDVQAHLDTCPGCRAYVDDALALRAAFPDVEETVVPVGFAEGVMAAVAASALKSAKKKNRWLQAAMPLAACLAVVIVLRNGPVAERAGGMGAATTADAPAMMETAIEAAPAMEEAKVAAKTMAPAPAALMDEVGAEVAMEATVATSGTAMKAAPAAAAENNTILYSMAVEPRVEIPAEAGRFLEDFSVAEETDTELQYHLSRAEFETLLEQMSQANLSPLAEEAVTPDAEQVLVVLKK